MRKIICRNYWLFLIFVLLLHWPSVTYSDDERKMQTNLDSIILVKPIDELLPWLIEESRTILYTNPEISLEYASKALEIAQEKKNSNEAIEAAIAVANAYINLGYFSQAHNHILNSIELAKSISDKYLLATAWRVYGFWFDMQGDIKSAIEHYHKALALYEELDHNVGKAACYNNIGIMLYELGDYEGAINFYNKSKDLYSGSNNQRNLSKSYCNLGNVYEKIGDYDTALKYLHEALSIDEELDDKQGKAATLHNIGLVYYSKKEYAKALANIRKSLVLCQELNDNYRIITRYITLSEIYNTIEKFNEGLYYAQKALELSREFGTTGQQPDIYKELINSYSGLKNYKEAFDAQKLYYAIKDSLLDIQKTKEIVKIQTSYEVKQSQQELEKTKSLAAKDRKVRNASVVAFILAIILTLLIYHAYRNKIRTNRLIFEKNVELEQANAEILAQHDELENQRDRLVNQNDKLEEVNNHITQSLIYAQSIQAAILPSEKILAQISSQYFVVMKPCEVVSGDFFWATCFDEYQVFCVADCTGHGVPGAFMSVLGITQLNDIVARHRITNPTDILNYLRQGVIEALSQNNPDQLHKDGMDIALCVYNSKTRELGFSGAGLPLWLVTKTPELLGTPKSVEPFSQDGNYLLEIKGDIMPVGFSPRMKPFANHKVILNASSVSVYLSTDGFADQIGGSERTKFGNTRLKKLILDSVNSNFSAQKSMLETTYNDWKGSNFQVDDVSILGIRL